jgi:hypothetical protein
MAEQRHTKWSLELQRRFDELSDRREADLQLQVLCTALRALNRVRGVKSLAVSDELRSAVCDLRSKPGYPESRPSRDGCGLVLVTVCSSVMWS